MWDQKVRPSHLYIHWPFCKNKCHYCDFLSFAKCDNFQKQYHDALINEISSFSKSLDPNLSRKISTIFFGGGTPSRYPLPLLEELFKNLNNHFDLSEAKEITIEANPGGVTEGHLRTWRKVGINRLSIGVQVLDDEALRRVNRHQTTQNFLDLMVIVPKFFENISVDLILGLPGVEEETWLSTLQKVISLPIQHISVYLLTLYDETILHQKVKDGEIEILEEDDLAAIYEKTVLYLMDQGFGQYEISNFAKKGLASEHNKAYWDCKPYRSFGLGASSFDGKRRFVNIKNLKKYIDLHCCKDGNVSMDSQYSFVEELSDEQRFLEEIMLGLRQTKGMDLHRVLYFLNGEKREEFIKRLKKLKKEGFIREEGGRIALTLKGMIMENEVILNLF